MRIPRGLLWCAPAARQFAHKPFGLVNLDDVVAAVDVSRGAMHFHFPSKRALARAVILEAEQLGREAAARVLANKLSGLETLASIGRADGLKARTVSDGIDAIAKIIRRAADEGDIVQGCDPADIAHVPVSTYLGIRHTSDLDDPRRFLLDLEKAWIFLSPGFANHERMPYFRQFVHRRTAVASGKVASRRDKD